MNRKRIRLLSSFALLTLLVAGSAVIVAGERPAAAPAPAPVLAQPAAGPLLQVSEPPVNPPPPVDNTRATVDLEAGFLLDPYLLRVAGSGEGAAIEQEGCTGYVSAEPDVVLNWSGDSPALYLYVYSDSDPVLLVETPDGEILCNDDAGLETTDPLIAIEDPAEGAYNIYVGIYRPDTLALGFLVITEVEPANDLAALSLAPLLARSHRLPSGATGPGPAVLPDIEVFDLSLGANGIFGDSRLQAGFETVEQPAAGGGDLPIAGLDGLGGDCRGFVSLLPAYTFTLEEAGDLLVFFEALRDSTLLVVGPQGELFCNDNAGSANLNPLVNVSGAPAGRYVVYIGNHIPHDIVVGRLTITADPSAAPVQLGAGQE